jgi:hypothetical protein
MGPEVEIVNCAGNFLQTKNPTCHGGRAQKKSVVMEASILTLVASELFATLTDGCRVRRRSKASSPGVPIFDRCRDYWHQPEGDGGFLSVNFAFVVAVEK